MLKWKIGIALVAAVVVAIGAIMAVAQIPADATYKGTKACKMCHGGMHSAIVQGYEKTAHPKAFADTAENPAAIVAEFGGDAPFPKEQVKYVLGKGRENQAYMDVSLKVLPAQWNVKEKKWEAIPAVDGATQCVGCHVTGYDAAAKTWTQPGVGCEECHGAGSAHASSGDKTKIVNPGNLSADKKAMVCGSCHSRGTDPSGKFAFPVKYQPGDDLSKVFNLAKVTGPAMNQQYNELLGSKHFANGVICTTCHEPHGAGTTQPHQLKKPVVELCMGCHGDKDMATHAPNAPAGATCATCHMPNGMHTFAKP